jgi:hypothetical protein
MTSCLALKEMILIVAVRLEHGSECASYTPWSRQPVRDWVAPSQQSLRLRAVRLSSVRAVKV